MRSLMEMMDAHKVLHEAIAQHRDLVVGLEFTRASDALEEFARALHRHIEDEERDILPLYAERVGAVKGGRPEYFYGEHARMRELLATLVDESRALAATPRAGRREAHEFLEKESLLLHLLEHHDEREGMILYPELDKRTSEQERAAILDHCAIFHAPTADSSPGSA